MSPSNSSPLLTALWSQLGAVAGVGDGLADRVAVDALTGDQDPSCVRIDLDLGDAAQLANLAGDHLGGVPVGHLRHLETEFCHLVSFRWFPRAAPKGSRDCLWFGWFT